MKAAKPRAIGVISKPLTRQDISVQQLEDFLRKHRCVKYYPTSSLGNAFSKYGIEQIYVDGGIAKGLLDNENLTKIFVENQRQKLDLVPNMLATFKGNKLIILTHEDGLLCVMARTGILKVEKDIEAIEIREEETEREAPWSTTTRPTMGETEKDMIDDEALRQEMIARLLLKQPPDES